MENILHSKLTAAFNPLLLKIVDESHKHAGHAGASPDGNSHFHIHLISSAFTSLTRMERHRLVHEVLQEELRGPIHALSLNLRAPEDVS